MAVNIDVALRNLETAFTSIQDLIFALAYVTGIAMVFRGIALYRSFANQTFGSAQRGEFAGPLVFIVVGGVMMYFPSTVDTSLETVFATATVGEARELLAYTQGSSIEQWDKITAVLVNYMKLIGLIAFFRGWIILSKMGHAGSQPGSIGKGMTHIVGGVLLMNIVDTMQLLASTFGFSN